MNKVFLYLYPIEEYTKMFLFHEDSLYDEWNVKRPLPILNECIEKRYRAKGYKVVFVTYPDKKVFGVNVNRNDKIIYTDIFFQENSAVDENGKEKIDFIPKYPDNDKLLEQLGNVQELVVGGYHYSDCVKRIAISAMNKGISTIIDLDMTDLFFHLYKDENYFRIDEYSPLRYKEYTINKMIYFGETRAEEMFLRNYNSEVYGFSEEQKKKR